MAYATETALRAEIVEELKTELSTLGEIVPPDAVIELKVKDAVREVKRERNYPSTYTDEMILADLERWYSNIKAKAIYKGNLIGSEYESSNNEGGISRVFVAYEKLSNGIVPLAKVL